MSFRVETDLGRNGDCVTSATVDLDNEEGVQITINQQVDNNERKFVELSVDEFLRIYAAVTGARKIQTGSMLADAVAVEAA